MNGSQKKITITSNSEFDQDEKGNRIFKIANLHTSCGGGNKMIQLKWDPVPGADAYALICVDDHPVAKKWVHLYIPHLALTGAKRGSINLDPKESIIGKNSFGSYGYGGPCPPVGSGLHRYVFHLFALNRRVASDADRETCRNVESFLERFGRKNDDSLQPSDPLQGTKKVVIAYGNFEAYYGR